MSVLCVFAPFALVTGVFGLRELQRRPDLMGRDRAWFGVMMGAVFTVLLVVMVVARVIR